MAADNYFPPKIKERALAILQAYRSHMLATTKYKTYGWDRVRNDIMKPYDKPGHRDNRLKPQHLTNFEKSGGRLSDPIFFFVNQFVLTLEKDPEYTDLLREQRSVVVAHYEKAFSEFYNVTVDRPDFSSSFYYFKAVIKASPPHNMICRLALNANSNLFLVQIIRLPLNSSLDGYSPRELTDFQSISLIDVYLPFFGFLLPSHVTSRETPATSEAFSGTEPSDSKDVVLKGADKLQFVDVDFHGTAKTTLYPAHNSKIFGNFDFSFTLHCKALSSSELAGRSGSISPLRPRRLTMSPPLWHSIISGFKPFTPGDKALYDPKDLENINSNRIHFDSIDCEELNDPSLFIENAMPEEIGSEQEKYSLFFLHFFRSRCYEKGNSIEKSGNRIRRNRAEFI